MENLALRASLVLLTLCAGCSGDVIASTQTAGRDASVEGAVPETGPGDGGAQESSPEAAVGPCGPEPSDMGCSPGAVGRACADVGQKYECVGGAWQCPAGTVPVGECGCAAGPQPSGPPLQPGDDCPDASYEDASIQCGSAVCGAGQACVHPACGGGWDPGASFETGPCPDVYCMDVPAACGGQIDQSCQCMGASNPCQGVGGCWYSEGHIHCMSA